MGKKKARSVADVKLPPWRVIAFGDLHVRAKTLARCLDVLARVRTMAIAKRARVVFTGDFWDQRGVLGVRQLDALLDEFARWEEAKIQTVIIPGNHDQVTVDGDVHGVRVFEPFKHITVATNRVLWPERKIAFIPWREDPAEQSEMFELPSDDWTIFAHAEVAGATTNHKWEAPGRVTKEQIHRHARACYCGHFHLRQQLSDRIWYLGSPYEQSFGEMGDPKGVAFIQEEQVEPEWHDFDDMAKHHRLIYREPFDLDRIRSHDVVEVYAKPDEMQTEDFQRFCDETVAATDVRPLPLKEEEDTEEAPSFALTLDQAIDAYVDEWQQAADDNGTDLGASPEDVKGIAHALLSELPEAQAVTPMSPFVRVKRAIVRDFCAVEGEAALELDRQGLVMLRGPIGVGKTAMVDAITWGLYGQTSPRKAGSHGSTFRGDEVVNDNAEECEVEVLLEVGDTEVTVTRTKKRGKGAKAQIDGVDDVEGISDTQHLIDHAVGMDHSMWRTCVSLGQGATGNFVTDADKNRKALLSQAYGLTVCPAALKLVRDRLKPLRAQLDRLQGELQSENHALEALRQTDYTEQIQQWEEQREATKKAAQTTGEQARATIEQIDQHLESEEGWLESKKSHEGHIEKLTKQLGDMHSGEDLAKAERDYGAVQSERQVTEQRLAQVKKEAEQLQQQFEGNPAVPCPTCGKPMEDTQGEKLVAEKQHEVERLERSIRTFDTRMQNLANDMQNMRRGSTTKREQIEAEIEQSREALQRIGEALSTFARLRANREDAEQRLAQARKTWQDQDAASNPFQQKAEEHQQHIQEREKKTEELREQIASLNDQIAVLAFWEEGFSPKGLPVLVLRTAIHELETFANRFMASLLHGRVYCQLALDGDSLDIRWFEQKDGEVHERRYEQLSGGQRRCAELAFTPFALSEMVFSRCGVRIPLLVIDELTTHLGQEEKPLVCEILRSLDRETVLVIDHDVAVQGEFDVVYDVASYAGDGVHIERAA